MTLREDYEWLRLRLGIRTPFEAQFTDARPGDEPPWASDPSNLKLRSAINNACSLVNQHVGLNDGGSIRDLPVVPQTTNGPLQVQLSGVPGFHNRGINSIRRAWWFDGTTSTKLDPFLLSKADAQADPYLQDAPGTPRRFAIEGYSLYIDPAPASTGTFRFMCGCGVLAPLDEDDGYDQIPADYDPCINYIALVELAKMTPSDTEMQARVQMFTGDAAAGLERLKAWFQGGSLEEIQAGVIFDARPMRRFRRRRR